MLIAAAASMGGESSIGVGLAVMMAVCCPLGALCLLAALKSMREAMAASGAVNSCVSCR